ncbi:hypothetical protein SDC9_128215 [bioreactor metagenome]|uniref:Uncharacterized protein n=1 Tax=bioreactor metagenome TaxID=1076179 RepID=A0A645CWB0_9ZZZZ
MIGNASCFLTPFYATIKFDTLKGGNDGKGYSFTIALNIENSDIQDTDIKVHREMQTQFFEMELQSVKKGIHPENGEKLSDIKTRDWGAGGSYKWTAQWDGKDLIRYSSYYTGKVDDVYFNMDVDGDDISVPEEVADKLASLAKESLTYKSLRSRIIKK